MSKAFKVGDRVEYIGPVNGVGFGVVDSVNENGSHRIRWLNGGTSAEYAKDIRIAPPVSVAPTLETATQPNYEVKFSEDGRYVTVVAHNLPKLPPPVLTFTAAAPTTPSGINCDVADYVAEHDRMRAALDTVRRFLGSHSFASCSLACNRELREVMAVVLAALDAERAGK